jgi:MtN3 and saliva related transmembrane protein
MLLTFNVGVVCWLAYGIALRQAPIIVSNMLTLLLGGALVALKVRHR